MQPVHIFFFRGLSTFGHDHAQFLGFKFGPIYRHLEREFTKREIVFHPVLGMGSGPLVEVAERAEKFILSHPLWKNGSAPVHFFGHSAGGLIARMVFQKLAHESRILSCLTLATPHQGAKLAQIVLDIPEKYRGSNLLLRSVGYDIRSRRRFFDEITRGGLDKIFSSERMDPRFASIVCAAPRKEWCLPLRFFYLVKAFNDFDLPSDGLVERDSQPYGQVIAELNIDHFRQVGMFDSGGRFEKLCDVAADYFKKIQRQA